MKRTGQCMKAFFKHFWDQSTHFIDETTEANKVEMGLFLKSEIKIKSVLLFILNHQLTFPFLFPLSENIRKSLLN